MPDTVTPAATIRNKDSYTKDPMAAKANTTVAYTDGACKGNPGAGGWGAHLIFEDGHTQDLYGGDKQTTNNRMELMGAIKALEYSPHGSKLEIWTDSSYVQKGITEWLANWKKRGWKTASKKPVANQDLWQQLDALSQGRDVDWHWVKGHAGHAGNEKADELANLGVNASSESFSIYNPQTTNSSQNIDNLQDVDNLQNNDNPQHTSLETITGNEAKKKAQIAADDWLKNDPLGFDMLDAALLDDDADADASLIAENQDDATPTTPIYEKPSAAQPKSSDTMNLTAETMTADNAIADAAVDTFDGDTSQANPNFRPLLPKPIHKHEADRQLIMDTETTGLDALKGDRIIEVGIVEMVGRKFTGEKLHVYINPKRGMEEEVIRIHGISEAFLQDKPTFDQVAQSLYDFMDGAEIIAHNASFDMNFLNMEFGKVGITDFSERVKVTDSLIMAKQQYPGQKNTLDALVRRLNVGKQDRTFHGALLDSEILAEVYLAMTGGQVTLGIEEDGQTDGGSAAHSNFSNLASLLLESAVDDRANQSWLAGLAEEYPSLQANLGQW